jgi:hypothetical protein
MGLLVNDSQYTHRGHQSLEHVCPELLTIIQVFAQIKPQKSTLAGHFLETHTLIPRVETNVSLFCGYNSDANLD